ncbi:hypothetical protein M885DRAFT_511900 [Pelagophyceae sp. CCMP2097]|nr:hypothetical protein M885DRAFT_511900 [Pelagophyceae sp. CCMP2097]
MSSPGPAAGGERVRRKRVPNAKYSSAGESFAAPAAKRRRPAARRPREPRAAAPPHTAQLSRSALYERLARHVFEVLQTEGPQQPSDFDPGCVAGTAQNDVHVQSVLELLRATPLVELRTASPPPAEAEGEIDALSAPVSSGWAAAAAFFGAVADAAPLSYALRIPNSLDEAVHLDHVDAYRATLEERVRAVAQRADRFEAELASPESSLASLRAVVLRCTHESQRHSPLYKACLEAADKAARARADLQQQPPAARAKAEPQAQTAEAVRP